LLVYFMGNPTFNTSCDVFEVVQLGLYSELWVKCAEVRKVLQFLEQVLSWGSILAFGNLTGSVRRSLPVTQEEFMKFASSDLTFDARSEIVVEALSPWVSTLSFLVNSSSRLLVDVKNKRAKAVLAKPVRTTSLFDARLRVLKPLETPPKLIKEYNRTNRPQRTGEQDKQATNSLS